MRYPKFLIINGVKWRIVFDKKTSGGEFYWASHLIKIEKAHTEERKFNILLHEICEAILFNNNYRYKKPFFEGNNSNDYLFNFNHDQLEIFVDELSGVLKQWLVK